MITPTLTYLEAYNGLVALIGLLICLHGWGAAKGDLAELRRANPGFRGPARLAQAISNLRVQQSLAVMCLGFLVVCVIIAGTPGGATFSPTAGGITLLILSAINTLIGGTSFMIQRSRWIVLSFRETNHEPHGVA